MTILWAIRAIRAIRAVRRWAEQEDGTVVRCEVVENRPDLITWHPMLAIEIIPSQQVYQRVIIKMNINIFMRDASSLRVIKGLLKDYQKIIRGLLEDYERVVIGLLEARGLGH